MSVATELTRIQNAKAAIKTAVANKGVTIPNDKLISEYADYIEQIQTGASLVVNSNNLDYFCADRPDFIRVLDETEVLTYFEYGGTVYNFDIDMHGCFTDCIIFRYDPIKLINKIINLNDKYTNINMSYAFDRSVFNFDMQKDTIINGFYSIIFDPTNSNKAIYSGDIKSIIINGQEIKGYIDIGIIDTMADLFVNFIGAFVFSVSGGFYIKHRGEKKCLAEKLIVKVEEDDL